jgi:hypothetical protein
MKTKFQLTVQKMLDKDGNSYLTARNILDLKITSILGLGLYDLPDLSEFADAIESIAEAIDDDINEDDIKMYLSEFTFDYIQDICM